VNGKSLRPLYQSLTAEERFRLAVQAGASGDHAESIHLVSGCPRVEGTVMDPSFTLPAMASFRLASAFARACGPYLGWLSVVEMLEGLLTGDRGRALLPEGARFPVAMVLDRAAEAAARDLRAMTDAFAEVCMQRTGLSPQAVLAFWLPEVAAALQGAETWIHGLEADAGTRERFKAGLDHAWTLGDE